MQNSVAALVWRKLGDHVERSRERHEIFKFVGGFVDCRWTPAYHGTLIKSVKECCASSDYPHSLFGTFVVADILQADEVFFAVSHACVQDDFLQSSRTNSSTSGDWNVIVVSIIKTLFYTPLTPSTEVHVDVVRIPTHSPVGTHAFETIAPCLGVVEILS